MYSRILLAALLVNTVACRSEGDYRKLKDKNKELAEQNAQLNQDNEARKESEAKALALVADLENSKLSLAEKSKSLEVLNAALEEAKKTIEKNRADYVETLKAAAEARQKLVDEHAAIEAQMGEIQAELNTAEADVAKLTTAYQQLYDLATRMDAAIKAKDVQIAGLQQQIKDTVDQANISLAAMEEQINGLTAEKDVLSAEKAKMEADLQNYKGIVSESLTYNSGIFFDPNPLSLISLAPCRSFVHSGTDGIIYSAIVCENGNIQWHKSSIRGFDASTSGSIAQLLISADESSASSCKDLPSIATPSLEWAFDRSTSSSLEHVGDAFSLKTSIGDLDMTLKNAALDYSSSDCADITDLAGKLPNDKILGMAAQVCKLVADGSIEGSGCFTQSDVFAP